MKNLRRSARVSAAAAFLSGVFAQFTAGPATAGEREEALLLCRASIAAAFQVPADESGAHFQESQTTARAYAMRFQVRTADGQSVAATCKVKRGALALIEIAPPGPGAPEKAIRADVSGPAPSAK